MRNLVLIIIVCAVSLIAGAEPNKPSDSPEQLAHKQFDPNKAIEMVAQSNPQKADELRRLKAEDPEKFRAELRKMWREKMANHGEMEHQDKGMMNIHERFAARHDEYIKFLEQNYPEEAAELAIVKEKTPELYMQRLRTSMEKYGRIAKAAKDNPELAAALKQDVVIKAQTKDVVNELKAATDDAKKKELNDKLRQLVNERFDLLVKQKELRYQHMNKRLKELQQQVETQQSELEKLKARKTQEVNERINELTSDNETIDWE